MLVVRSDRVESVRSFSPVTRLLSRVLLLSRSVVKLTVKRRSPDFKAAGDLGHLAAIMRDRKADNLVLHLLKRPDFAGRGQHRQHTVGGEWSYRYFITGND